MKTLWTVLIVASTAIGATVFAARSGPVIPKGMSPTDFENYYTGPLLWEHTCVSPSTLSIAAVTGDRFAKKLTQVINQHGRQGWQLAAMDFKQGVRDGATDILCFKRLARKQKVADVAR